MTTGIGPADLERYRQEYLEVSPDADEVQQLHVMWWEVIDATLGTEWASKNITPETGDQYLHEPASGAGPKDYVRQHRLFELGRNLYELQHLPSFDEMVTELRRRSLFGATAELNVAHLLDQNGHAVRFVPPSGRRGDDFDEVVSFEGFDVSLEVKAKQDDTPYSRSSLTATIKGARKQLPESGPGLIAIRLPTPWVTEPDFVAEVHDIVDWTFRNSHRINGVIFLWDQWVSMPAGMQYRRLFRVCPNPAPVTPVPNIDSLLQPVTAP